MVDLGLRIGPYRLSVRKLRKSVGGIDLGPLQPALPKALYTKNKRIDLAPQLILDELTRRARCSLVEGESDDLLLIGRRHLRSNNSWMHNSARLVKGKPRHQLLMNPDDLSKRDLNDGQLVAGQLGIRLGLGRSCR